MVITHANTKRFPYQGMGVVGKQLYMETLGQKW